MSGLRRNALRFPLSTRVLCRFVTERVKDFHFTSLSLLFNVQTDFHVDSYNSPNDDNCVLKISNFEQGGVWVEHPQGGDFRNIRGDSVPGKVMLYPPLPGRSSTPRVGVMRSKAWASLRSSRVLVQPVDQNCASG